MHQMFYTPISCVNNNDLNVQPELVLAHPGDTRLPGMLVKVAVHPGVEHEATLCPKAPLLAKHLARAAS